MMPCPEGTAIAVRCVEEFVYGSDGTIPELYMTREGVKQGVGTLSPYRCTEAETIAWSEGVTSAVSAKRGVYITGIHDGDYIKVRDVDFGETGPKRFVAAASSRYHGGEMELRIDGRDGEVIGTLRIPYTGEWENWGGICYGCEKRNGSTRFVFRV